MYTNSLLCIRVKRAFQYVYGCSDERSENWDGEDERY